MATPIRDRIAANHPIAAAVVEGVRNAAASPGNALRPEDTAAVAAAVTDAMNRDPVVQNATNSEPWYQSRVYVGIIFAAIAMVGRWLGLDFEISANDQATIMQALPIVGLAIAAIGRGVKNLPPIRWSRPWTLFGIGR